MSGGLDEADGLQVQFAARLRRLREDARNPPYRVLAKLTRDFGRPYSYNGIRRRLTGETSVDWAFVEVLVQACALYQTGDASQADLGTWHAATRDLQDRLARRRAELKGAAVAAAALAAVPPGADFTRLKGEYLARLRQRYGRVDLEVLTPLTEQGEQPAILLGEVFVPQSARLNPPPVELPRELWQRLVGTGEIRDGDIPGNAGKRLIERVRRTYQETSPHPVLDIIAGAGGQRLVFLGDPGAGKSTLARYLMLALAGDLHSGPLTPLAGYVPLLVELRAYVAPHWRTGTFLDLIGYQHASENLGFPKPVLEAFLAQGGRALMVFDGLDEIFDPALREQVTRQIEAFANRYRQTRVIVTSRPTGYPKWSILEAGGFTHYLLQDLSLEQIRTFTAAWYGASLPEDPAGAARLRDRLLGTVSGSAAVAELAGNPMLLTILAIIG